MNDTNALIQLFERFQKLKKRVDQLEKIESGSGWIDYSSTSTVSGWTSFTTKEIFYKKIGRLVLVVFNIEGTSNSLSASFTVPDNLAANPLTLTVPIAAINNGSEISNGIAKGSAGNNQINLYTGLIGAGWAASGTKTTKGQFWYQMA